MTEQLNSMVLDINKSKYKGDGSAEKGGSLVEEIVSIIKHHATCLEDLENDSTELKIKVREVSRLSERSIEQAERSLNPATAIFEFFLYYAVVY